MEIARVRPHLLSLPLPRPVKTSAHDIRTVDTVLVEMEADGGAVGTGYCFAFGPKRAQALHLLVEDLLPLYQGQDAATPRAHFERAWRSINFLGHAGLAVMALAALDTACWDLAAQGAGLPLYKFLGGGRDRIPTYASSGLWLDYSIDELLLEARRFLSQGHRAMKMRLGRSPQEDIERVKRLREAIGPEVKLLADVNQGWDEATAIRVGRELEPFSLYWLEEPLPYEDLEGCARVAAALTMPIATGETDYGSLGMKRHLEVRAADILMPDLQRMGGVTEFLPHAGLLPPFHGGFLPPAGGRAQWPDP
jgi:L-alanine-DL-glutamate epimerase-like enolase superfamily enzyme